ncbi:MAG: glycosyltransferase family 2 protein [bacterium]|nr:glycosyltransferase family 2 protein [bacterium]
MYKDQTTAVVIPAYNEEKMIGKVIETMPDFVDTIVIVDDASVDRTAQVVEEYITQLGEKKLVCLRHSTNLGNGAARISGLRYALQHEFDVTAMMDGDGQMDPEELSLLLEPIVEGEAEYTKGNRLFSGEAWEIIPRKRYFGNAVLSLLTKIASGYWHIADFQSGYVAISLKALQRISLDHLYHDYGFPNDMLIHLNVYSFRVKDIPIRPIYNVGEQSNMNVLTVIPKISRLLFKRFLWRIKQKYIIRDFHPLVFFYAMGFFLLLLSLVLFLRLLFFWISDGYIPQINALAFLFSLTMGSQSFFFAMWFDMDCNKHLK